MTTDEIKQLSKQLKAECDNIDGLPELNESRDIDGNPVADVDEDVVYLADVTAIVSDRVLAMCDVAEIAAQAALTQAKEDAYGHYSGGDYDNIGIEVTVDDGEETIRFDGGKVTVFVTLKIKVDASRRRDPSPVAMMARR